MYICCVFGLLSMVLYITLNLPDVMTIQTGHGIIENQIEDKHLVKRRKRALVSIIRGVRALNRLISDATKDLKQSDDFRTIFRKVGNYRQALKDFLSISPDNLRILKTPQGKLMTGDVGNRKFILRQDNINGTPSIEVIQMSNTGINHIDTIKYET